MAGLRWRRLAEERGYTGTDRATFLDAFATWLVDHEATHLPFIAEMDGQVVGMAWLMVAERVPTPAARKRLSGDVQSVLVVPERRNGGVGAALLEEVLAEAARLDLEHVTVHSSDRAVPFYQRVGFEHDRTWLRWKPEPTDS
ncbi:GNAT family N-acetyltransferase [Asanoa sp. NPDC050611]|uniref:GNAT family N-acetyltransferase n=1 Tax=Asanoa sp. NPDC050611 TaxID=3157098 RepID=UPI0033C772AF